MDKKLLTILCCPVTHRGLALARAEQLEEVNRGIRAGTVRNREGRALADELREALITDDGKLLYPVDDGIPVLLEGEAVRFDQLQDA